MSKVRVYEVARELGLDNRELVNRIASLGIQVRNHMSALDAGDVERVKRAIEKEKGQNLVEERIRPTVVRRRAVAKKRAKPAAEEQPAPANAPAAAPAEEAPAPAPQPAPEPAREPAVAQPETAPAEVKDAAPEPRPEPKPEPAVAKEPEPAVEAPAPEPAPEPVAAKEQPQEPAAPAAPEPAAAKQAEPAPEPKPEPAAARPQRPREQPVPQQHRRRPSQPPPASERLAHSNLPPGVVARGNAVAPSAPALSSEAVSRIVQQHNATRPAPGTPGGPPRRRELGRAALGPTGRQQGRPGRPGRARKMAPGRKAASTQITTPSAQKRVIRIEGDVNLQTLAGRMSLKATDVLMKLMQLGLTGVNINSSLDVDTAKILAGEFGYEVENVAVSTEDMISAARGEFEDTEKDREGRSPVVTVMGHVDHGKTSLLDKIRTARVAAREAGGITQHIGAYRVEIPKGTIVFLDTPGHEAFTAMRARGAESTDIVILVVAADDGVMPQTKEAIAHAKAAGVPIVVAVNKIDKEDARPEVVLRDLANEGLQPEDWGGDIQVQNVSAHTGEGIDDLLDKVLLQAELLELRANPTMPAEGTVLEAYLDKGRGPVANVLVRNGSMKSGDAVVAGTAWGKVKAITDDRGKPTKEVGPASPVEILGLSEVPSAGESFYVVTDTKKAQEIAEQTKRQSGSPTQNTQQRVGLDQIHQMMQSGDVQELKVIIKADVQGSIEALVKALNELSTEKVKVNVIHTGVGGITENDVLLATASNCIVIGFNVRPAGKAAEVAKSERIDVRLYKVIYEAVDEVKAAMAGLLAPQHVEKHLGKAEVRQVFTIPKVGAIAGCSVSDGKILRNGKARVVRDSVEVWSGNIRTLRRFKDDVREVASGYECGIGLEGFNDIKEHDVIECFEMEQVAAQL